ncbi:MAG: DnaJ domain-containing protein [Mycetocola sp.]
MSRETHYDVLGAPHTSTAAELKQAYRRALRTSHPDLGGSAESFRIVQAAWAVLGDAARRAEYDRLHMPRASAPPKQQSPSGPRGDTRRERSSSRRANEQQTPPSAARATPTFATVHGHPGGRSRARYLDISREWMLSPQPPPPPAKPPRIRHEHDRFLHMWGVVFLQLTAAFAAVIVVLILIGAVSGTLPPGSSDVVWSALRAISVIAAGGAFLCGGLIAVMRLGTSPARAEVRRVRVRNQEIYRGRVRQHRAEQRQFADDLSRRPDNTEAFLTAPFSYDSVMCAPAQARAYLDRALAQEQIALALKTLNAEFTVWHDVLVGDANLYASHLVVGPQGLFLVEPLLERSRIDAPRVAQLAEAIGGVRCDGHPVRRCRPGGRERAAGEARGAADAHVASGNQPARLDTGWWNPRHRAR